MAFDPAGKRVLVTGASSWIGAALAKGLAARGAVVGICGRDTHRLETVLGEIGGTEAGHRSWTVDLSDLVTVAPFAELVVEALGGLDLLVNNAGIPKRRWAWALAPDEVDEVMTINYLSPVRLTLAALPALVASGGHLVNVSSVAAHLAPPAESAYAASKAALNAFSEGLAVDLAVAGHDVGVHVVNPAVIDTPLFAAPDNDATLADVAAEPVDAIVAPVLDALDDDRFEVYVPGYFADFTTGKAADVESFLRGSADYARQRLVDLGRTVPPIPARWP